MRKKLHDFMDKMKEKPVEERQRLLMLSTIVLGGAISLVGIWNMSNSFVALNNSSNLALVQDGEAAVSSTDDARSIADKLRTEAASVWGSMQSSLKDLNNKLGPEGIQLETDVEDSVDTMVDNNE